MALSDKWNPRIIDEKQQFFATFSTMEADVLSALKSHAAYLCSGARERPLIVVPVPNSEVKTSWKKQPLDISLKYLLNSLRYEHICMQSCFKMKWKWRKKTKANVFLLFLSSLQFFKWNSIEFFVSCSIAQQRNIEPRLRCGNRCTAMLLA